VKRKDGRLKGYGVFVCRICGAPIPAGFTGGLRIHEAVTAGYCSHAHLERGRRYGWPDDPPAQTHR